MPEGYTPAELALKEAIGNLLALTECRCDPAWTGRDGRTFHGRETPRNDPTLHDDHCLVEYREDVHLVAAAALNRPTEETLSDT